MPFDAMVVSVAVAVIVFSVCRRAAVGRFSNPADRLKADSQSQSVEAFDAACR